MKKILQKTLLLSLLTIPIACGGGSSGDSSSSANGDFSNGGDSLQKRVIENFVNEVILNVYAQLDAEAQGLLNAVNTFIANPTDANLQVAQQAWIKTRLPWELSETALFGPVDFNGFDPALDSWPVNRIDLDGVLASNTELNTQNVAHFDPSVRGFHTIEYLLFGVSSSRTAEQFDSRTFDYLRASTTDFRNIASLLLLSWTQGVNGSRAYAQEFISAGSGSTIYPSESSALEEIARGMITIADEVANGKIGDPFDTRNTDLVESQFSFNSLADFSNNIRGLQRSYELSLSEFIASKNLELDQRLKAQINVAIASIGAIPAPFRDAILNSANDRVIKNAQEAIRTVQRTLENEIIPLILE